MDIGNIVRTAYRHALTSVAIDGEPKSLNKRRSTAWVEALASRLRDIYRWDDGFRVFSRGSACNRSEFQLNELLYDITVVRVDSVLSPRGIRLYFPVEVVIQAESEFHRSNSRASIIDFGKLVLGTAANKLLILPQGGTIQKWALENLKEPASYLTGRFFLAFVAHPGEWDNPEQGQPVVYRLENKRWIPE